MNRAYPAPLAIARCALPLLYSMLVTGPLGNDVCYYRIAMRLTASLLGLALCCCGESNFDLTVEFDDPVVEAQARSLTVHVIQGIPCEPIWDVRAAEVPSTGPVIGRSNHAFPVDPSDTMPDVEGTGRGVVHITARDAGGFVVARGCGDLASAEASGRLQLQGLPECSSNPPALDLAVVFDGSSEMQTVDSTFGGVARVFRASFIARADFPPGSRFSAFVYGPDPVTATVDFAERSADLAEAIDELESRYSGPPDLFGGITRAARTLRDRASCSLLPVVVTVAAGSSSGIPTEAAFSLYAAQGDRTDDIFAYGVGLTQAALNDLNVAIPDSVGETRGARSATALATALEEASFAVRSRTYGL